VVVVAVAMLLAAAVNADDRYHEAATAQQPPEAKRLVLVGALWESASGGHRKDVHGAALHRGQVVLGQCLLAQRWGLHESSGSLRHHVLIHLGAAATCPGVP